MSALTFIPEYPVQWVRFIRRPVGYLEQALQKRSGEETYKPWEALICGLGIVMAMAAYEAHRAQYAYDKWSEQLFLLIVIVLNAVLLHCICRALGGKATVPESGAVIEYLYGFMLPTVAVAMRVMIYVVELFPGIRAQLQMEIVRFTAIPTTGNILVVSLAQTALIVMAVALTLQFNIALAAVQQLPKRKVLVAQVLTTGLLMVVGNPVYVFAQWLAVHFKELASIVD